MQSLTTIADNYANISANLVVLGIMIWLAVRQVKGRKKPILRAGCWVLATVALSFIIHSYPIEGANYMFNYLWPSLVLGAVYTFWWQSRKTLARHLAQSKSYC
jgi:hypothetical protein